MIGLRKANDRFHSRLDWLDSRHTFSFASHYDPVHMGHGPLRVLNEDWIAPRSGFPSHPHREMEILTYMLAGTLTHQDSVGNATEIHSGRAQLMHAGRGIVHSELNHSDRVPVHLLQIWIEPDRVGVDPAHHELDFAPTPGTPTVLASRDARHGGLELYQDATVSALTLDECQSFDWPIAPDRLGWIQVARGSGSADALSFGAGDGLELSDVDGLRLTAGKEAELLLFDLPS